MKIQNSWNQWFPNLQLNPSELASLQQIITQLVSNDQSLSCQCQQPRKSNMAPARIDSWRPWHQRKSFWFLRSEKVPSFTRWKTAKSRYHSRVCIGLGGAGKSRCDVEKEMYTQTLNIWYIYSHLMNLYGKCRQIRHIYIQCLGYCIYVWFFPRSKTNYLHISFQ